MAKCARETFCVVSCPVQLSFLLVHLQTVPSMFFMTNTCRLGVNILSVGFPLVFSSTWAVVVN